MAVIPPSPGNTAGPFTGLAYDDPNFGRDAMTNAWDTLVYFFQSEVPNLYQRLLDL
jgi:hypothetical protein